MCYKLEKHREINLKLRENLKDVPMFISNFFNRYKSAGSKKTDYTYIINLLQWLVDQRYINKESISEITEADMDKVETNHIIQYLNDLQLGIGANKNTLSSIGTKKSVFSSFWKYMVMHEYVTKNIILNIPSSLYKTENTEVEVEIPTDEQLEEFIARVKKGGKDEFKILRNLTIIDLFLGSGIRLEELINMDVDDLYLNSKKPYIKILGKGKLEVYDTVYISDKAKNSLLKYLNKRERYLKNKDTETKALFVSNLGTRISKGSINNLFKRYSDGKIYPHMLRHWHGSMLYQKCNNIVMVQRQLRHRNVETAARYYIHIDKTDIADIISGLW